VINTDNDKLKELYYNWWHVKRIQEIENLDRRIKNKKFEIRMLEDLKKIKEEIDKKLGVR